MQLGTLLVRLKDQGSAAEALAAIGDLVMFTRVCEVAEAFGESPGEYVAASVARFAAGADEEAWVGLVGVMARSEHPGNAALARMLAWALEADTAKPVATGRGA